MTGGCRNTKVMMKKARIANAIMNPSQFIRNAQIAKAAQVISARRMPTQSRFALRRRLASLSSLATVVAISTSDSTTIATPYQIGKNAGPGPSSP